MDIIQILTEEFSVRREQAENVIALLDDGKTVPFIARYRKEMTGALDDQTIRRMALRLQALRNLEALILQEGGDRSCVLRTTAYISDMANWGAVNDAYREFFGSHKPARTIAAVPEIHFGFLIEIDGIAILPILMNVTLSQMLAKVE